MNSRQRRKLEAQHHNERRELIVKYHHLRAQISMRLPRIFLNGLFNPTNDQLKRSITDMESVICKIGGTS